MPRSLLQPIPRELLPKDLQNFPDILASEQYSYRAVARGPAKKCYDQYESSARKAHFAPGVKVAFSFPDIVMFFASAAGTGIIGNIAYAALVKTIKAVRKPKKELFPRTLSFEAFISRNTYSEIRREYNERSSQGRRTVSAKVINKIETNYRLIVKLKNTDE
jgi:hypothetical protein